MTTWVPDGSGIEVDSYAHGGDATVTDCFVVTYVNPNKPNARITEYHYGESRSVMDPETNSPFFVTCMTEYHVHDGNENEVWTDYTYEAGNDVLLYDGDDALARVEAAARRSAELSDPQAYLWDGEPMWGGVNNPR